MASNQPWKSKVLMMKLCVIIGATLQPDRTTTPQGKRVYVVQHEDKNLGFYNMKAIYDWLAPKLKHGGK
jgi:hypothetical protein